MRDAKPKKPQRVDSKILNRRQSTSKNDPCAQIAQRGQKSQKPFATKEMVNPCGIYLEKMKTQKRLLSLVERK
jgi:hypothetical protein